METNPKSYPSRERWAKYGLKPYFQKRPYLIIPAGLFSGLLGGVIARSWMRWISTNPEFSWSGTLGIMTVFTLFGAVQSTVYVVRRKPRRKWLLVLVRSLGVIFTLPLFGAAGSIMFPTVLTISLAQWRSKWKSWIRVPLSLIGLSAWGMAIYLEIIKNFGWSIATIGRILLMGIIYSGIIYALKPTISARI